MTASQDNVEDFVALKVGQPVMFGDGEMGDAVGYGTALIRTTKGEFLLKKVLVVPGLASNILSVSQAMKKGVSLQFEATGMKAYFIRNNRCIGTAYEDQGLFWLATPPSSVHTVARSSTEAARSWHAKLGHTGYKALSEMLRKGLIIDDKLPPNAFSLLEPCAPCIQGKMHRVSHRTATPSPSVLHCVSSDLMGPFKVPTYSGEVYNMGLIDHHTSYGVVRQLKAKSESMSHIQSIIPFLETQSGAKVKRFRSDRGGEYISAHSSAYFESKGIIQELTAAYTPEQNGKAERFNRTLMERTRTVLAESGLPNSLWGEAMRYACDSYNVVPQDGESRSPYEKFFGFPPDLTLHHPFGAKVWIFIPKKQRHKLQPKAHEGRLLGYHPPLGSHSYRVLVDNQVLTSCDVFFQKPSKLELQLVESEFESSGEEGLLTGAMLSQADPGTDMPLQGETLLTASQEYPSMSSPGGVGPGTTVKVPDRPPQVSPPPPVFEGQIASGNPIGPSDDESDEDPEETELSPDPLPEPMVDVIPPQLDLPPQSSAAARALVRRGAARVLKAQVVGLEPDPKTVSEALSRPDGHAWQTAIDDELASLMQHNCWTMVPLPPGAKAVGSRLILERKKRYEI